VLILNFNEEEYNDEKLIVEITEKSLKEDVMEEFKELIEFYSLGEAISISIDAFHKIVSFRPELKPVVIQTLFECIEPFPNNKAKDEISYFLNRELENQ
jgi:hypothetical protein